MKKAPDMATPGLTEFDPALPPSIMDGVVLPSELARFAEQEVAAGRYRNVGELVRAGLDLLRERGTAAKAELLASVLPAQEEGERAGYLSGDKDAVHIRAAVVRRAGAAP